jgi:hypothetical protein
MVILRGRARSTHKRCIVHAENDDTLMLGGVFCYPSKVCFHDMVSVQEGHFAIRFYPNLGV